MKFPQKGLYAITQTENKSIVTILSEVEAALKGGVVAIQCRDKSPADAEVLARTLLLLCHHYNVPLIINDNVDLAKRIQADGVHLGKNDVDIALARQQLGREAIIGVSCYDDSQYAKMMQGRGADYVAFGRFFPSTSKPLAAPAHIQTLQKAKELLTIPIVAIGGILPENGGKLLQAGADLLAVIGGVFNHEPHQAALAYQPLFDR